MDDKTLVERLIEFEKFIRGHDTLDGLWFGDTHSDFKGAFWWRRFSPIKEAAERIEALEAALLAVVDATRAYLPPDGISEQECINRILEATDNPTINPIIAALESQP